MNTTILITVGGSDFRKEEVREQRTGKADFFKECRPLGLEKNQPAKICFSLRIK